MSLPATEDLAGVTMDIAQLHFLVAEADASVRSSLCDLLLGAGAGRVTQVADGVSALRCFQESYTPPIQIAIVNIALPGMDGIDLIRNLAGMNCRAGVIIIGGLENNLLLTIETMSQAYGLELLGTLATPVKAQGLKDVLRQSLPAPRRCAAEPPQRFSFAEVSHALQERQFAPYFQPRVALETGHIKGLEAFARWIHPEHGVLRPTVFIDALEENNRIDFLDWSMIERSVDCCRQFQDEGLPLEISLNVAPETLAHPDFIEQIAACVERHQVAPMYLTFEMPESAVLTTDPAFLERLVRLRMLGYGLAIDDYGTGRSNLQMLARVPFTELKIDRSFVDGASRSRALGTVLSSCLGLARSLQRESCAVGVETRQDWDYLQGLGCTYAQGYHIAPPMAAEAVPRWMRDWLQFFD